ncbi:MAG: response regulator [Bacteroidota bacterium]
MNRPIEILLIDDSTHDAYLIIRALKKCSLDDKIVHFEDSDEALDFLMTVENLTKLQHSNTPKLILLDLKMPRVNGIEVLKKIKSNAQVKSIPVVVFSSSKDFSDVETCYESGANSYVVKPVAYEDFSAVVEKIGLYWVQVNVTLQ